MAHQRLTTCLTFSTHAEEAMRFYVSILPNAQISELVHYRDDPTAPPDPANADLVLRGALSLTGIEIMFLDMGAAFPPPAFTWATSLYLDCRDEAEFDLVFEGLSQGGEVMMGPMAIAHVRKCAWVTDKFGVTWQPVWE
jgi:predicted 3-demethylubiquinone-9 3-methyltransferase (glyoxalase superfamily)